MKKSEPTSFGIKSKWALSVKSTGLWILIQVAIYVLTPFRFALAEDIDELPQIKARTFDVTNILQSKTGRVILFESPLSESLPVGRLLLMQLKDSAEPTVAVRVLKIYPVQKAFAAKSIRYYGDLQRIAHLASLTAIEKLSDIDPNAPITENPKDQSELKEIEEQAALDGKSPQDKQDSEPSESSETSESSDDTTDESTSADETNGIMIEEVSPFEKNRNSLTLGASYLHNTDRYFAAGGLRYGLTLIHRLFFNSPHLQDSLTVEGGAYFYKAINFSVLSDSYSLINTIGTARYNLFFSEVFGTFLYGGVFRNFASATSPQSTASVALALSTQGTAIGAGFLVRIGPNWYTRIDVGTDIAGLGLVLQF